MNTRHVSFWNIILKTVVTHTITYFLMGLLALFIFDYATLYAETSLSLFMRQTSHPLVMAGPLFQPLRGFLFGVVFFLLREVFFDKKYGWLVMWVMLVIVGILSPFGPSPGSIEGMIYTVLPLPVHMIGQIEVYLQSLLLSIVVFYWVNHPAEKWLTWLLSAVFFLVLLLPTLGLLVG